MHWPCSDTQSLRAEHAWGRPHTPGKIDQSVVASKRALCSHFPELLRAPFRRLPSFWDVSSPCGLVLNLGAWPALSPARLHLDPTGALLLLRFRQRDREHAVLKPGLNLLRLDRIRNPEAALEGAVRALDKVVVLLLVRTLGLLLPPDREHVIVERHLDVVLSDAGQLGADFQLLVGFAHIDVGHQRPALATLALAGGHTEGAAQDIIEQAVHLAVE